MLKYSILLRLSKFIITGEARALIEGMYIHTFVFCPLISSKINLISKEISRIELEYMNIHLPINAVASFLFITGIK